jgi:hypothetical protein
VTDYAEQVGRRRGGERGKHIKDKNIIILK